MSNTDRTEETANADQGVNDALASGFTEAWSPFRGWFAIEHWQPPRPTTFEPEPVPVLRGDDGDTWPLDNLFAGDGNI